MRNPPRILLLTSTITPAANVDNLQVRDPAERLQQYLTVFEKALGQAPGVVDGVVFTENSGADLAPFRALAAGRPDVELVNVEPRAPLPGRGRGYLETALVLDTFRCSHQLAPPDTVAWKVTGRYWLHNLPALVRRAGAEHDLIVNLRRRPQPWADMWMYGATRAGMEALEPHLDLLLENDASGSAETRLYDVILRLMDDGLSVAPRLPVEPRLSGVRGYDGVSYDSAPQRLRWIVRTVARRVAPKLWI